MIAFSAIIFIGSVGVEDADADSWEAFAKKR